MQAIGIGGVTLHVQVEGPEDGHALVFSNSLGTDLRVWDPLMPHLPPGLRIVRYDKRGHGLSDCPAGPWSIADHVADLAGLLDRLDVREATICGLSVGGLIAQALAAERPDLVRSLILCDTAAKIGNDALWNDRIAKIEAGGIEVMADGILERWFSRAFRESKPALALWRNMLVRTPGAGYVRTAAAIRDADYTDSTRSLRLPCLAVCGEEDGATPPDLVRATAALIPNSRFEVIGGAGHLPSVEQPAVLGRLISAHLEGAGATEE